MAASDSSCLSEDQLVWHALDCRNTGFFVDVGAHDARIGSQTYFLEEQGWEGILIEPQSALCEKLRNARPHSRVFQVACGAPGQPEQARIHIAEASSHSSLIKNFIDPSQRSLHTEPVTSIALDDALA